MKKYLHYMASCLLLWIASPIGAQQVANPTLNIPTSDSPTVFPAVPYPGLINMTGVSKFNLVKTIIPDQPYQTLPTGSSSYKYRQATAYYDGLGRPLQTVEKKAHGEGYDIVQHHVYDQLGRERYGYLPFAAPATPLSPAGIIKKNTYTQLLNFYNQNGQDEPPYARTDYDDADEDKAVKELPPGRSWVGNDKGVGYNYSFNLANEVRQWDIGNMENEVPVSIGYYKPGSLYVTLTTDEDGREVREYKDKSGQLILKKVRIVPPGHIDLTLHINFACTYYVYDDQGQLRYVIPPLAVNAVDGYWDLNLVPELCFSNSYDERGRLISKKVPGKELEEFVYDKRDRLVISRDGNLRNQNKCFFTFYDPLDRPVVTGLADVSVSREVLAKAVSDNSVYPSSDFLYYVKNYDLPASYPTSLPGCKFLTYTYYDNYSQIPSSMDYDGGLLTNYVPSPLPPEIEMPVRSLVTRGLVTGTKVRVLDPENPGADQWLYTANYFDNKGRLLQVRSSDLYASIYSLSHIYNFQGMVWKTNEYYQNNSLKPVPGATDGTVDEYLIESTFTRSLGSGGSDRVWKVDQRINNGPLFNLANYDYDHLGRITIKDLRAGLILQEYNIRGLLTHIAAEDHSVSPYKPIFDERLRYDWGFRSKLFNSNIAGIIWSGSDGAQNAYGYSYDNLNRLTHAESRRLKGGSWINTAWNYTVSNLKYDLNGNMISMDQMGGNYPVGAPKKIDALIYNYLPYTNRLAQVEDNGENVVSLPDFRNNASSAQEYDYDRNGNLTRDDNKKISAIGYTHLNKPNVITTDSGTLYYVYDAQGLLLQKRVKQGATVTKYDYVGNFMLKDTVVQYILNEEGRARPVANAGTSGYTRFVYDYFIKDHLGNVRSTVTANPITSDYFAGHEIATANLEQLVFDNIPSVRDTKPGSINPVDGMAAHLVASDPNKRVGTAIMLKVMPGDKFSISANTYYDGEYNNREETGTGPVIESLVSALMGGGTYAGVPVSELPDNIRTIQSIFSNPALSNQIANIQMVQNDPGSPKAHLNYLFFNDKFELQPDISGAIQIHPNTGGSWQTTGNHNACNCNLSGPAPPGFVVIYIDNQSIGKDVWFDDVHIEHYTSSVLSEDHYYPYGLTIQTLNNPADHTIQTKKFNGKELNKEFGLEFYDFGDRIYNPQIARWNGVDNSAENYDAYSPYCFVGDNPVRRADIDGNDWQDKIVGQIVAVVDNATGLNYRGKYTPNDVRDYRYGQFLGDVYSMLGGTAESGTGTGMMGSSVVVTAASGGLALEITAPVAALGSAMTVHGALTGVRAVNSIKTGESGGTPAVGKKLEKSNTGRSGKQSRLKELGNDPKASSADRGWIKQEVNQIDRGKRKSIRNPGNKDLAHKRGKEAAKGYSYKEADLQTKELHRLQHKYDNFGRKNKDAKK